MSYICRNTWSKIQIFLDVTTFVSIFRSRTESNIYKGLLLSTCQSVPMFDSCQRISRLNNSQENDLKYPILSSNTGSFYGSQVIRKEWSILQQFDIMDCSQKYKKWYFFTSQVIYKSVILLLQIIFEFKFLMSRIYVYLKKKRIKEIFWKLLLLIFSFFFQRIVKNLNCNATSKPIVRVFIASVVKNCDVLVTKKVFHWNQKHQKMVFWWFKIALMLLLPIYTKPIAKV